MQHRVCTKKNRHEYSSHSSNGTPLCHEKLQEVLHKSCTLVDQEEVEAIRVQQVHLGGHRQHQIGGGSRPSQFDGAVGPITQEHTHRLHPSSTPQHMHAVTRKKEAVRHDTIRRGTTCMGTVT